MTVFEPELVDEVTAVLIVVDGITLRPVTTGVEVELVDRAGPGRLIRNLSGRHVLLNGVPDQPLTFRVRPERAGFRGPVLVEFTPTAGAFTRVVPLERLASADFDDVATVVRGEVVRGTEPVPGVSVRAVSGTAGRLFPATTDERGVFVLAVPLDHIDTVTVRIQIEEPPAVLRELSIDVRRGRAYVFARPVDLDDPADIDIIPNRP